MHKNLKSTYDIKISDYTWYQKYYYLLHEPFTVQWFLMSRPTCYLIRRKVKVFLPPMYLAYLVGTSNLFNSDLSIDTHLYPLCASNSLLLQNNLTMQGEIKTVSPSDREIGIRRKSDRPKLRDMYQLYRILSHICI